MITSPLLSTTVASRQIYFSTYQWHIIYKVCDGLYQIYSVVETFVFPIVVFSFYFMWNSLFVSLLLTFLYGGFWC